MWGKSYEEFDDLFLLREGKSIADLLSAKTAQPAPENFREIVTSNLRSGTFHLFIAVDQINEELEKIIAYVSSRGTGLKLQALELRTYGLGDLEILAPQRHGEFVPPVQPSSVPSTLTMEQVLSNCPDDHSRGLFKLLMDLWQELGYEVKPGTVGAAFRANVGGTMQSIFWASRGDLQGAFSVLSSRGAPADAVAEYRSATSQIRGFDPAKFLHDQQPITKFSNLTEVEVQKFATESDKMVRAWCEASIKDDASGIQNSHGQ